MILIRGLILKKLIFDKSLNFERLPNSNRTSLIAYFALIISLINFMSGFCVFLYMKSPKFENQLLGQVIKNLGPLINYEIKSILEERN